MEWHWWVAAAIAILVVSGSLLALRPVRATWRQGRFQEARRDFHRQRERLEAKFVQLGMTPSRTGSPRWVDCEFEDDVTYVRNRFTGELSAFVGVTLEVEAPGERILDGGPGNNQTRTGTAVFRFDRGHWSTEGRAIINLSPAEAIRFYQHDLELVGQEVIGHI